MWGIRVGKTNLQPEPLLPHSRKQQALLPLGSRLPKLLPGRLPGSAPLNSKPSSHWVSHKDILSRQTLQFSLMGSQERQDGQPFHSCTPGGGGEPPNKTNNYRVMVTGAGRTAEKRTQGGACEPTSKKKQRKTEGEERLSWTRCLRQSQHGQLR